MKSLLQLQRMIVMRGGGRVYDEKFHNGLNIIRGANGSGKSSIVDLMFYGLGGELEKWKEHAAICDDVILELKLSESVATVSRQIEQISRRPMRIFAGNIDNALSSASDGWTLAPFARDSELRRSFSESIFEIVGLPQVPVDGGSSITMHQILRLMYVDQTSPFQKIFRAENFDPRDTREAVAELLCGIGSLDLFSKRMEYRSVKAQLDEVSTMYSNLSRATISLEKNFSTDAIGAELAVTTQKIEELHSKMLDLETSDVDESDVAKESASARRELHSQLSKLRDKIIELERTEKSLLLELEDSENFIDHLEKMSGELESAALVFVALGDVKFETCPACFAPLEEPEEGHCHLCGTTLSEEDRAAKAAQLKLDIEGQIRESKLLQSQRSKELVEVKQQLRSDRNHFSRLARQLNEVERAPVDGRLAQISSTSREIGSLEARSIELEKLAEIAEELSELGKAKRRLQDQLNLLTDEIKAIQLAKDRRRRTVLSSIADNARYFINRDLEEHNDFERIDDFAYSFEDDWFAVNGDPNISSSASGMVMLKNCLMMGILKTSLEDPEMLYPRFLIQDNGEDKGMVPNRVMNFQQMIADWSDDQSQPHQIILTTSTLNPGLDSDEYVVGPTYTKEKRTLQFSRA